MGIELLIPIPNGSVWPYQHAKFYHALATAYYKSGNLDNAITEYNNILKLVFLKLYDGDIISKSHYELAKIYGELGEKEKAVEFYNKFLEIWKEADEDLPELIDAKKRLGNLM